MRHEGEGWIRRKWEVKPSHHQDRSVSRRNCHMGSLHVSGAPEDSPPHWSRTQPIGRNSRHSRASRCPVKDSVGEGREETQMPPPPPPPQVQCLFLPASSEMHRAWGLPRSRASRETVQLATVQREPRTEWSVWIQFREIVSRRS